MAKIFISYRRTDSQHAVDRLQQEMKPYVKNPKKDIFVDVDNIPIGRDFEEHLQGKVGECDALLAVIGPDWLNSQKEDGTRRLDDPEDFVRTEIAAALERNIPVVPVLLDGVQVPREGQLPANIKALAKRNGAQLDRKSFAADVEHIMTGLGLSKSGGGAGKWLAGLAAAALIGVGGWFGVTQFNLLPAGGEDVAPTEQIAELPSPPPEEEVFSETTQEAERRADLIARYQAALGGLEYYDGVVDGIPGDGTHDASKAFTAEHGRTNLGLDYANLDAIERLVIYAEDTLDTKILNDARFEQQKADAEAKLQRDLEDQRKEAEAEIDRERQRELDKAREDARRLAAAEAKRLAAIEAAKPDWSKGLTGDSVNEAEGCLKGLMIECFKLGRSYDQGNDGAPQNYRHSHTLHTMACNGGNIRGCNALGYLYHKGLGVNVDYGRARALYTKACDGGLIAGCYNLGDLYYKGVGVSVDYGRARTLFTKACDGGLMVSCNNLGTLYYDGKGVSVDKVRSKQLHQKACNGGSEVACETLRDFY